ncbi:SAF domain-containing protein [Patescibacteria group bacterium]|nr:SAF domain-containing protein [Patescibacteria group bacterium]
MKKALHIALVIGLLILSIVPIALWEFYLNDRLNTVEVVIATKDFKRNDIISQEDVALVRVEKNFLVNGHLTDPSLVIGKEAKFIIPKNAQITADALDDKGLVSNDEKIIAPLAKEWVYAMPGSLRRKDTILIYTVKPEDLDLKLKFNYETGDNYAAGEITAEKISSNLEEMINEGDKPVLDNVIVAYVKDTSNNEVKPVDPNKERLDATGNIANVELVLSQKEFDKLRLLAKEGHRFIIAYK